MSPLKASIGPYHSKKYWPKPVSNTGKVPVIKAKANDLFLDFESIYGWNAQKSQINGSQFPNP